MGPLRFNEIKSDLEGSLSSLSLKQIQILIILLLNNFHLTVIRTILFKNNDEEFEAGFRKPGDKCPFCKVK